MHTHCCQDMCREVEQNCGLDVAGIVRFSPVFREYGPLICDDGSSSFRFCPWCGTRLPESLRDRWFAEVERLGIDPWEGEVPEEYQSSAWWTASPG